MSNPDIFQTRVSVPARRSRNIDVYAPSAEPERPTASMTTVVWRRRWIVIGCIVAAMASGVVYLIKATPIYSSSSVVYVQEAMPKVISDGMSSGGSTIGYLFTQCQLIQSTAILSAALELPGVSSAECLRGIENPVGFLKTEVTAQPSKQGELIIVSMESTDPRDAALIVNGVVEAYIEYQAKQHKSTAVEVLRILQKEMSRHEAKLKEAQEAMLTLKKETPELSLRTEKGSVAMTRFSALTEGLSQALLRAADTKAAFADAQSSPWDVLKLRRIVASVAPSSAALNSGTSDLVAEYRQQERLLDELRTKLGPKNDAVIQAKRRFDRVEAELNEANQRSAVECITIIRESLEAANARVQELNAELAQEREDAKTLNVKELQYEQLAQGAQRTERALDLIDGRMKEVNVTEDVGALTVTVLETAKPSWMPVRPKRPQTLGMALVAGLMVGLGGAFLRDTMDQRLRSAEEIAAVLDLPILGGVPHIAGKTLPSERGQELVLHPRSDVAEAYRSIRTAIYFGLSEEKKVKSILVTSPSPGEGKSTSTSNLAIAIAQSGRRVLLIDADCRRPVQHKIFKMQDGPGLSDVLVGKAVLRDVIRTTSVDKLELLQCGHLPHNPAELLNSQQFLDLLREVTEEYDQVLIDSPPIVPVTDSRILAASCDATILVLRAERSTRRLAEHARDGLFSVGANVLGIIINDVPRGQTGYGYYYYGYGKYGYTPAALTKADSNGNGKHLVDGSAIVARRGAAEA
jgi:succinoglycan biosynthesis transport protein ExoP